mgnify:CR=1 FL=1
MAANLATFEDGRFRMYGWGRIPIWHGTGQRSDELLNVKEAGELGGTWYMVDARPAMFMNGSDALRGQGTQIVRTDTLQALGTASDKYSCIQNKDAFGLLQPFIDSEQVAGIMTSGVLGQGEKAWMQAIIGTLEVGGPDRALGTIVVLNSHDATGACVIGFTSVYVVCGNTFASASLDLDGDAQKARKVYHVGDTNRGLRDIAQAIDIGTRQFKDEETVAKELAQVKVEKKDLWKYWVEANPISDNGMSDFKADGSVSTFWKGVYGAMAHEYFRAPGHDLATRDGTAFGAFSSVVGYCDYMRHGNMSPEKQARFSLFGKGAKIKRDAMAGAQRHFLHNEPWGEDIEKLAAVVSQQ